MDNDPEDDLGLPAEASRWSEVEFLTWLACVGLGGGSARHWKLAWEEMSGQTLSADGFRQMSQL